MTRSRTIALAVALPVLAFAAIQLVPYGRNHANPPDGALILRAIDTSGRISMANREIDSIIKAPISGIMRRPRRPCKWLVRASHCREEAEECVTKCERRWGPTGQED